MYIVLLFFVRLSACMVLVLDLERSANAFIMLWCHINSLLELESHASTAISITSEWSDG